MALVLENIVTAAKFAWRKFVQSVMGERWAICANQGLLLMVRTILRMTCSSRLCQWEFLQFMFNDKSLGVTCAIKPESRFIGVKSSTPSAISETSTYEHKNDHHGYSIMAVAMILCFSRLNRFDNHYNIIHLPSCSESILQESPTKAKIVIIKAIVPSRNLMIYVWIFCATC